MLTAGQLFIKPTKWEVTNIDNKKFIECIGTTSEGSSIYVRLPCNSTILTTIVNSISNEQNIIDANRKYIVLDIGIDDGVLIIRVVSNTDSNSNNNGDLRDRYGPLSSLWAALDIGPYEWLTLNNYTPLPGKYTICDLNVSTDESYIEPLLDIDDIDYSPKLMLVDYRPLQQCLYLTTVKDEQAYNYEISWVANAGLKSHVIRAQDEDQALTKLFGIYSHLQPDLLIYFGKETLTTLQQYLTKYKPRLNIVINIVVRDESLPLIDLQQYINKFHSPIPHNTLQEALINTDSQTLYELCSRLDTIERLTTTCNNIGVTYNELLTSPDIIDRIIYNMDPSAVMGTVKAQPLAMTTHLKSLTSLKSLDSVTYVYDYTELYRQLIMTGDNRLSTTLGILLEDAPPMLIAQVFFSKYVDRTLLLPELRSKLTQLGIVDSITITHIYSSRSLSGDWLRLETL